MFATNLNVYAQVQGSLVADELLAASCSYRLWSETAPVTSPA